MGSQDISLTLSIFDRLFVVSSFVDISERNIFLTCICKIADAKAGDHGWDDSCFLFVVLLIGLLKIIRDL